MRISFLALLFLIILSARPAQSQSTLSGTILDSATQKGIPFATIAVLGRPGGTVSNEEGAFRLSVPAGADSVRAQALGYSNLDLGVPRQPGALTLRLSAKTYQLQEVTVNALTPTDLVKLAVRQTTAMMVNPAGLQTYYREFSTCNDTIAVFADGLIDYYIQGNARHPHSPVVQARVLGSRVGKAKLSEDMEELAMPSHIKVEVAGNYYDVTRGNPFLDSVNFKYYDYTLLESPPGAEDEPYYQLRCTPITHDRQHLQQATVRIDRDTKAIRLIETEVPASHQPYLLSLNLLMAKAKVTQIRKRLEYQEADGQLYPSFVRIQKSTQVSVRTLTVDYEDISDMLVRSLRPSPLPIPKAEQFNGPLNKRGTRYTQPYWREGNVVAATAAEEAAIQKLDLSAKQ